MRGDLGQTPAADLCRGLADAGSTGSVTIAHPSGEAGIYFRGGHVYWAESPAPRARLGDRLVNAAILSQEQLVGALRTQAESSEHVKLGALLVEQELVTRDVIRVFVQEQLLDALFEIMGWDQGSYEFIPSNAVEDRLPVELSVDQMLVEVSRRQSEWDQIQVRIPSLDMVPDFVTGGSSASAALEPDEFAVLASVDGRRSIRDLAADLGYSEFEAARIVYGLALLGIVDVRTDDEPLDAAVDDEPAEDEGPTSVTELVEAGPTQDRTEQDDALDDIDDIDDLAEDAGDAAATDLEVDLDELADAPDEDGLDEDDDVDVASALEEALYGPDEEPAEETPTRSGPPSVKIHDEPGGFQWDALDGPVEDQAVPPPPPPAVAEDDDEPDAVASALSAALEEADVDAGPPRADVDEVEAGLEPVVDEEPQDEPEPFVLDGDDEDLGTAASSAPATDGAGDDFDFFAQPGDDGGPGLDDLSPPPTPADDVDVPAEGAGERVSGADLDDSDFDRLLDELAGTGSDGGAAPAAPYTSTPEPAPGQRDAPAAADDEMPSPPRSGSDVSEFLRELSRLTIDEPPPAKGGEDREDESSSAAEKAASAAADARKTPPPPPSSSDDGKGKKRGLFGRKR